MAVQTKVPPVRLPLRARPLDPKVDSDLFSGVTFGPEPYAVEVEDFLRRAVELELRQEVATTVFLLPEDDKFVGFFATRHYTLNVDDDFRQAYELSKTKARNWPTKFDACFLVAFGVNAQFQARGYAPEIHFALVNSLSKAAMRPPFIFLKVWEDNPAADLYRRWLYRDLGEEQVERKQDGRQLRRLFMVLKTRPERGPGSAY